MANKYPHVVRITRNVSGGRHLNLLMVMRQDLTVYATVLADCDSFFDENCLELNRDYIVLVPTDDNNGIVHWHYAFVDPAIALLFKLTHGGA